MDTLRLAILCLALCTLAWVTHAHAQTVLPPTVAAPNGTQIDGCEFLKLSPQHISLSDLTRALQLAIGDAGRLAQLDGQDIVLVSGPPEILKRAVRMMEQVDLPRVQLRLAIYAYDVDANQLPQLSAAAAAQVANRPVDAEGVQPDARADKSQLIVNPFHVIAAQLELDQLLKLLNESSAAKLIADPQLTVVDRQVSQFQLGTRLPSLPNAPAASDVGFKLTLTPRVLNDSSVQLHVVPEYVSVVGWNDHGAPVLDVRRVETTTRVANGQTVVIGGLKKHTTTELVSTSGNLIKTVGPLFRSASTTLRESELICIVRPEIIGAAISPRGVSRTPEVLSNNAANAQLLKPEPAALVQSGAYQEPAPGIAQEQVKPSAYRPSNYARQPTAARPTRNINTSRNSVTQPLPTSMGNRNVAR